MIVRWWPAREAARWAGGAPAVAGCRVAGVCGEKAGGGREQSGGRSGRQQLGFAGGGCWWSMNKAGRRLQLKSPGRVEEEEAGGGIVVGERRGRARALCSREEGGCRVGSREGGRLRWRQDSEEEGCGGSLGFGRRRRWLRRCAGSRQGGRRGCWIWARGFAGFGMKSRGLKEEAWERGWWRVV